MHSAACRRSGATQKPLEGGWPVTAGFVLERLRDAKRIYEKTTSGRARDARQELHHAERAAAPQRRAPVSAHQGTPGRDWRGLPATVIAVKTPTISTASGGCGRSMGGFAF